MNKSNNLSNNLSDVLMKNGFISEFVVESKIVTSMIVTMLFMQAGVYALFALLRAILVRSLNHDYADVSFQVIRIMDSISDYMKQLFIYSPSYFELQLLLMVTATLLVVAILFAAIVVEQCNHKVEQMQQRLSKTIN